MTYQFPSGFDPKPVFEFVGPRLTPPGWNNNKDVIPLLDAALAKAFGLEVPESQGPRIGLTDDDWKRAAASLGGSVAQIRAVWDVECSGSGWFTDVRGDILLLDGEGGFIDGSALLKILFEAHWFDKFTNGKYRKSHPNLSSAKWNRALYVGGQGEWIRLHNAMQLDREAALLSASAGGPQIMGFNFEKAGFSSVEQFWEAMKRGDDVHLDAFVSFIKKSGLTAAFRKIDSNAKNCEPFTGGYNGSGQIKVYSQRIATAHRKYA